jgi:hypothetical protein
MGHYYPNAKAIPTIGRYLSVTQYHLPLETLQAMLTPDEVLVGFYEKLRYSIAPLLETQRQVDDFFEQYCATTILSIAYYAVPREQWESET